MLESLDRFIVDATLVLRHEDIVLLALLFRLNLSVERVEVLLLCLLLLHLLLLFSVLLLSSMLMNLLRIHRIVLATQNLCLLLSRDLVIQHPVSFILEPIVVLPALRHISLNLGIPLSELLDHDLLVSLLCVFGVTHRLVVAVKVVLGIILELVVLQLREVVGATLLILVELPRLQLSEELVSVLDLLEGALLLDPLLREGVCVVSALLELLLALLLVVLGLLSLLIQVSLLLNLP